MTQQANVPTLTTTRYVKPGTYVGRIIRPNPVSESFVRTPCYVAKGSRLQTLFNIAIRRSFRTGVALNFSVVAPNISPLTDPAVNDKTIAKLYKSNGEPVPLNKWKFIQSAPSLSTNPYDTVLILPEAFDPITTYFLDYQSNSRTVIDELPFTDLRLIRNVGNTEDQGLYQENQDFRILSSLTGESAPYLDQLLAADTNLHGINGASAVGFTAVTASGPGAATVALAPAAAYDHKYSRQYTLRILAVTVTDVEFAWESIAISGGNEALPHVPVSPQVDPTSLAGLGSVGTRFLIPIGSPVTTVSLAHPLFADTDLGVQVDINVSGATAGRTFTFTALGPGIIEFDSTHSSFNDNQFAEISDVVFDAVASQGHVGPTTGGVAVSSNVEYAGQNNRSYVLQVLDVNLANISIAWQGYGELGFTSGVITLNLANPLTFVNRLLERGIRLDFSDIPNFEVNDTYRFDARAPRKYIIAKDNRDYKVTVTSTGAGATAIAPALPGVALGLQYVGNTIEANFGILNIQSAPYGLLSWFLQTNVGPFTPVQYNNAPNGGFVIPGDFYLYARNLGNGLTQAPVDINRFCDTVCTDKPVPGDPDLFTFSYTDSLLIDWSPQRRETENFTPTDVFLDAIGTVTGVPGRYYVILAHAPSLDPLTSTPLVLAVNSLPSGTPLPYISILDSLGNPTVYLALPTITFATKPSTSLSVRYQWRGLEPDPSGVYYVTADRLRPNNLYNTPQLTTTLDDARRLLGPSSPDNDAYIMAEIAFANGVPQAYWCQVKDTDSDGNYATFDYETAITGTEKNKVLTDVVVLNNFASLPAALASNEKMNDPFELGERVLWVGMPANTAIGDPQTPGTLAFTARNTLQVFGDNPAHGRRILLGQTFASKTIQLNDGSLIKVALDGSFVAGAAAAKNASFADPSRALLYQTLAGFDDMQTYSEPEELQIGSNSILYLHPIGTNTYRFEESVTVDTSDISLQEINVQNQSIFVTRDVRTRMNQSLIGFVPDSEQTGVALITTTLANILVSYVSRGINGPYTDANGQLRPLDPKNDIVVFRAKDAKTLYNFTFYFNGKYVIKRLFGLFSVDRKLFGNGVTLDLLAGGQTTSHPKGCEECGLGCFVLTPFLGLRALSCGFQTKGISVMRRVLYVAPISLDRKEYERDAFIEEILTRTRLLSGTYIKNTLSDFATQVYNVGGSFGIVSNFDPRRADSTPNAELGIVVDPATGNTLLMNPGLAVFSTGEIIIFPIQIEGISLNNAAPGTLSVVYLQFFEEEALPELTRYNDLANTIIQYPSNPNNYVQNLVLSSWQALSVEDLKTKIPLAIVSVGGDGSLVVDSARSILASNRPWFSPVDIEHRSFIGTGLVTENNIHGLSLNDVSAGNNTLFTLLLDTGMIVSKDINLAKLPGLLCFETIKKEQIQKDTTGVITGVVNANYFYLGKYPTQLIRVSIANSIKFDPAGNVYDQRNANDVVDIAGSLVPKRNMVVILELDEQNPGGDPVDLLVSYMATNALNPNNNNPNINASIIFKEPANTVDETVVAGGLVVQSPVLTCTLADAGYFPKQYTVFMLGDGFLYKTPQPVYCYARLSVLGNIAQGITINQLAPARIQVGLTQAVASPTLKVTIRLNGLDVNSNPITYDIVFDSSNWQQDVDVQNNVHEISILESKLYQTVKDADGNEVVFKSISSLQVVDNIDSGFDAAIMVWALVDPVKGSYVTGTNNQVSSMLPVVNFIWDGLQVLKDNPLDPKKGQPKLLDMRPINTRLQLPRTTRYGDGVKAMGYASALEYVTLNLLAPNPYNIPNLPYLWQTITEDFDAPKYVTTKVGNRSLGAPYDINDFTLGFPEPCLNLLDSAGNEKTLLYKTQMSKLQEALDSRDVFVSRPIAVKPYYDGGVNPIAVPNRLLFTRFFPIFQGKYDTINPQGLGPQQTYDFGFNLWARFAVVDQSTGARYWSVWYQLRGPNINSATTSFSSTAPQWSIDYHAVSFTDPTSEQFLVKGNPPSPAFNLVDVDLDALVTKVQFICTGPVKGMGIMHFLDKAPPANSGYLIYDIGIFDEEAYTLWLKQKSCLSLTQKHTLSSSQSMISLMKILIGQSNLPVVGFL